MPDHHTTTTTFTSTVLAEKYKPQPAKNPCNDLAFGVLPLAIIGVAARMMWLRQKKTDKAMRAHGDH